MSHRGVKYVGPFQADLGHHDLRPWVDLTVSFAQFAVGPTRVPRRIDKHGQNMLPHVRAQIWTSIEGRGNTLVSRGPSPTGWMLNKEDKKKFFDIMSDILTIGYHLRTYFEILDQWYNEQKESEPHDYSRGAFWLDQMHGDKAEPKQGEHHGRLSVTFMTEWIEVVGAIVSSEETFPNLDSVTGGPGEASRQNATRMHHFMTLHYFSLLYRALLRFAYCVREVHTSGPINDEPLRKDDKTWLSIYNNIKANNTSYEIKPYDKDFFDLLPHLFETIRVVGEGSPIVENIYPPGANHQSVEHDRQTDLLCANSEVFKVFETNMAALRVKKDAK